MSRVGDKWTLLVIGALGSDRQRFAEIADMIPGISRRMLTVTLRALERDGLVTRTVHTGVDGRTVTASRLIRTESLTTYTAAGAATLASVHHVDLVIDLRTPGRFPTKPDVPIPRGERAADAAARSPRR